jgi:hypothetical protein
MATNALLRRFDLGVIAVVQDHPLNITEDRLDRMIIGTAFRQSNPMQFQLPHRAAGLVRLAGVGRIPTSTIHTGCSGYQ